VVFIAALAAPQGYLHFLAGYLAGRGWGALMFEYRGVGASRHAARDVSVTLDVWVHRDLTGAVSEVDRPVKPEVLRAGDDSILGQLLGQSSIRHDVNGALFIAAQRGVPKFYKGIGRLRVEYAYAVFPILIRLFGRLPISSLTFPDACSGRAVRQWVEWGRDGVFADNSGA